MTYAELEVHVQQLPLRQRLDLMNVIMQSVRGELTPKKPKTSSAERLRGFLKTDTSPPTDAEVADMYVDYLLEKHS